MIAATLTTHSINGISATQNGQTKQGLLLKKLLLPNPDFSLHNRFSRQRQAVENYIATQFKKEHDATIQTFMPVLMTMQCCGQYSAAAGLRHADSGSLYLEQYLDLPVEKVIKQYADTLPERSRIVEIGNLVATRRGASHLLFILIAAALIQSGADWMVFTATAQVERILKRFQFKTHILCKAAPERLNPATQLEQWGSYYQCEPNVLAGDLSHASALIENSHILGFVVNYYKELIDDLAQRFANDSGMEKSA